MMSQFEAYLSNSLLIYAAPLNAIMISSPGPVTVPVNAFNAKLQVEASH